MRSIPGLINFFKNKYLVALLCFSIWIVFFDRNDLFTQWDRKHELSKLEAGKEYYQSEIKLINKGLADLQNNPAIIEKYARENFHLKRSNEDIFIIEENVKLKNQ